ncbi:MAG: hypothetical protein PF442_10530 [Desulfobulbaceae bacterium]|jgi:hypothetical protein|nr:hypothetical protein [Desulfobulbaceae bacterium]
MECKRLNRMIRDWYVQVQDETLAPARMVEFMQDHAATCDTCFVDPNIDEEIKKIIAIVLPPSKMTKKPKKKIASLEPTAAALAAIEAGKDAAVKSDADDDADDDDEIEVGDDDDDDDDKSKVGDDDDDDDKSEVGDADDDDDKIKVGKADSDSDTPDVPSLEDADLK